MNPAHQPAGSDPVAVHRAGDLEVRLANPAEVDAALALRFRVFCEERGANRPRAVGGLEEDA